MPFNQLVLPLLGGYLIVIYASCFVYWSSRQSKEHLLFASAFVGAILLLIARCITLIVSNYAWGAWLHKIIHAFVNYQGIGTAVLALILSCILVQWINKAWQISEVGFWLYGRGSFTQLESLLYMSFSGVTPADEAIFRSLPVELGKRLAVSLMPSRFRQQRASQAAWRVVSHFDENTGKASPIPLLLSMKDRKVYVGILEHAPPLSMLNMAYINIVVMLSGYRNKDDLNVNFTDDYTGVFNDMSQDDMSLPSCKVVPICDIASVSLFDMAIFDKFQLQHNIVKETNNTAKE
ncbi:MAG TPA: hypothetical protein VJL61_02855 [Rhodanobacteraceae bacterium]|nr:hypothetical protein [Rhodanobacteraceae bacterium]